MMARLNFTPLDAFSMMRIPAEGRFSAWRDHMTLAACARLARYPGRIGWHNGRPLVAGGVAPHPQFRSMGLVWMVASPEIARRDYVQLTRAWRLIESLAPASGFAVLFAHAAAGWPAAQWWLERLGFHRVGQKYITLPGDRQVTEFFEYERMLCREARHGV